MANNGARIPVPQITDLSREELQSWRAVSDHPLLDGQLIEDITLSTTTKYTRVPHALGRPYRGFIDVRGVGLTEDQTNPKKNKEIWLYRESAPVLLDEVTLTTASSTVTFSNLTGDTDVKDRITGRVNRVAGTTTYLVPNSSTASQVSVEVNANGTAVGTSTAGLLMLATLGADYSFTAELEAETGKDRILHSTAVRHSNARYETYSSAWNDTSTAITTLAITNNSAGFGTGSVFKLYALENRATKASIWIF